MTMDWPDDIYDGLDLTLKTLKIIWKFATTDLRERVMEKTAYCVEDVKNADLIMYNPDNDHLNSDHFDKITDDDYYTDIITTKLVKNIYKLVKHAVDGIKDGKDYNHMRSTITLICMDAAAKHQADKSTLFSQKIPAYVSDTLLTSMKIVEENNNVTESNYEKLLNNIPNSKLATVFSNAISWDTAYGNWEVLLYKQLLADVMACAQEIYLTDVSSIFK
jgi:hypothetical protein